MYGIFVYMKGEKWPHEQGEMYLHIVYMEHFWLVATQIFVIFTPKICGR